MNNLQILSSRYLVTIFFLLATHAAHVAAKPPDCPNELVVTPVQTNLDFGAFVGISTGAGSVVVDPVTLGTTYTPNVFGLTPGTLAVYKLTMPTQCKNKNIFFTAPDSSISGGGSTFTVTNFAIDAPNPFKTGATGITIKIGGTLNVIPGAMTAYTGPFTAFFVVQ